MTTRIVHISDLHFPAAEDGQAAALAQAIADAKPDVIAVTGDLTRRGRRREFEIAAQFMAALPAPKIFVPGNHDVPLFRDRIRRPFARFAEHFAAQQLVFETADLLLVGFNTAVGVRLSAWDWSLGNAPADRIAPVAKLLREKLQGRIGIVACHHPLRPHVLDVRRSTTRGGLQAFTELADAGMRVLLHGHLHRASQVCVDVKGVQVCEVCANTALSDRERAGPAGFNILDVEGGSWTLTAARWQDQRYGISDGEVFRPQLPAG